MFDKNETSHAIFIALSLVTNCHTPLSWSVTNFMTAPLKSQKTTNYVGAVPNKSGVASLNRTAGVYVPTYIKICIRYTTLRCI